MEVRTALPAPPQSVHASTPQSCDAMPLEQQWWNVNVPEEQWTEACPEYLDNQETKNIGILSTKDENHPRMPWADVKHLIAINRIDQFHRMPSDLRHYLKYCYDLKKRYGSVLYFMQHERLGWPSLEPSGQTPFVNETDYKILYNDWPYAIDIEITHIVIWTKFVLEDDPQTGELNSEYRDLVEEFVMDTFCRNAAGEAMMDRNDLIWFKNWRRLRSVHALEHFHVMLYKAPQDLIHRITHGDRPMYEKYLA